MIVLIVVVDTLGRLYIDPSFHASEVALGTLIGALLLIVGIEGAARLRSAASDLAARPPRIDPDRPPDGGDA